jgi:hypothetical protein
MCLTLIENSEIKAAEENIVCYKVVQRLQPGIYRSEFRDYIYNAGALNYMLNGGLVVTTCPVITYPARYSKACTSIADKEWRFVERGFHSFTCKEDAYKYNADIHVCSSSYVVVKCVIPKGANYVEGTYMGYLNYASDKIICVKEV